MDDRYTMSCAAFVRVYAVPGSREAVAIARRRWRRARLQGMKMWAPTSHTRRRHFLNAYDVERMFSGLVPKQGAMRKSVTRLADGFQSMLAAPGQLMRKLMRRRQAR